MGVPGWGTRLPGDRLDRRVRPRYATGENAGYAPGMAAKKSAKKTTAKKTAPKKKTGGKRKATAEETATGSKPAEEAGCGEGRPGVEIRKGQAGGEEARRARSPR